MLAIITCSDDVYSVHIALLLYGVKNTNACKYIRVVQLFPCLRPRTVFLIDPRAKKSLLALCLKTNNIIFVICNNTYS